MKKLIVITFASLLLAGCATTQYPAQADVRLAENGKTAYVIALADDAIPAEKTAADQLQQYLQQITGAQFSIEPETAVTADAPQILVGAGTRVKVLLPKQDWESLGADGIVIKTVGKNLILAGGRPRGTLYAVFQFLESQGCNWWTPTEKTIPHKSTFTVPSQNVVYVPPFNYREQYTNSVQNDPIFATMMRENGNFQKQSEEWGGHYTVLGFVHTFSQLLPPEKYFKDHPEWYSDPDNGYKPCTATSRMPAGHMTQLNLSDPQMLDELTKQALAWIEKNPDAGYIAISQNDNDSGYCRDAASMALAAKEDSQAAPVINFVNKVAERIHQKYPDFKVMTLAYRYTEKPPKTIRPGKNVVVRMAPISSDYGHPLNSDWNAEVRDKLLAWAGIAPNLFIWNYVTNFTQTMLPHPDWAGLGPDLRFFAANNVKGVFEQGDRYTNGVGDFVQLRTWLIAHLMWNPQLDQEKLTQEFLQGYYGAAAPYLKQYLDEIQHSFLAQKRALSTYNQDYSFINLDVANKSIQLFDQAEAAVADNSALLARVQRDRLSFTIGMLHQYKVLKQAAAQEGKKFLGPKDPSAAMDHFIEAAEQFGVQDWKEGGSFNAQIPHLKNMFATPKPVPLPDFAKKYPPGDVVDLQSSFFKLYASGDITHLEKDAAASDGTAASIIGNTDAWAIQTDLARYLDVADNKWHIYLLARVETNDAVPQSGAGFSSGVYDAGNNNFSYNKTIPLSEVAGAVYKKIDMGVHQLNSGMLIWVAPTQNPAVTKVYVDRIILIREK